MVKNFFDNGTLDSDMNQTSIVLILKINHPESWSNFWPISLCYVTYKLITKILANRLKLLMYKLVNPLQASFIKGHHIIDNVIIPQEIIHSMEATKGRMGYMVAKIDLANAYNRLSWNFIIDTLFDIGFPHYCINLIIKCLTTSYM